MKLQLAFFDEDDLLLNDWSAFANRVVAREGWHGFESLESAISADLYQVAALQRDKRPHRVQLNYGIWPIWDGRLEDIAMAVQSAANRPGFDAAALGYWSALGDVPYTALWSTKRYLEFETVTSNDLATATPGKYVMENSDHIFIAPVSGENFAATHGNDWGAMVFWTPYLGERKIKKITFSYNVDLPTNWTARVISYNEGFASSNVEHTITTSGSGSATVTLGTDKDGFIFVVSNGSLGGVYTGETEAKFAKWTNVRVWTTDSANLYADEVVEAVLSFVNGINTSQLSASTVLIESPAVDLIEALYEDELPVDIVTGLADGGDSSAEKYEVGVGLDKILYFRPKGSDARTWYVGVDDLVLTRSLEPVANSIYTVYRDERGRKKRTAASSNSSSIADYALTRRRAITSNTSSDSQAQSERNAELARTAYPPPQTSRMIVTRITDQHNMEVRPWQPKPGDTVVIRDIPPEFLGGDDSLASFRIDRKEYNPMVGKYGQLAIETESLSPTIETYIDSLLRSRRQTSAADIGSVSRIRR